MVGDLVGPLLGNVVGTAVGKYVAVGIAVGNFVPFHQICGGDESTCVRGHVELV